MSGRREFMMEKENTFIGKDDLAYRQNQIGIA